MLYQIIKERGKKTAEKAAEARMREHRAEQTGMVSNTGRPAICTTKWTLSCTEYEFSENVFDSILRGSFYSL